MATQEFRFDAGQILQPAFSDPLNKLSPAAFGASLTLTKGQSLGRKTADGKLYPFNNGNSDGTQIWAAFNQYPLITDASGNVFFTFGSGASATPTVYSPAGTLDAPVWTSGVFDPTELSTAATPVAEVDTFTPATVTTGDVNKLAYTSPNGTVTNITFTIGGTATATAASAGLIAAWNANATTAAVATATGTTTVILTAVTPGTPFTVASSVVGTGTLTRAATTAASGRALADVQTGSPGARVQQTTGFWRVP